VDRIDHSVFFLSVDFQYVEKKQGEAKYDLKQQTSYLGKVIYPTLIQIEKKKDATQDRSQLA
jgi:hypothetical protein